MEERSYTTGSHYKGEFNGQRSVKQRNYIDNGGAIIYYYVYCRIHGRGEYTFPTGTRYEGNFKDGM